MDEYTISLLYSVIKAYGTNSRLQDILGPGLSGVDLFRAASEYVTNLDDDSLVAVKMTHEYKFYCWDQLAKTNTQNYWRKRDVNIKCDQFYNAEVRDYQIDKDYTP
jgi:hypothetical protein